MAEKLAKRGTKSWRSQGECHSVIDNDFQGDFDVSGGLNLDLKLNQLVDKRAEFIALAKKRGNDVRLSGGDCGEWLCSYTAAYWQAFAVVHGCLGVDMSRPIGHQAGQGDSAAPVAAVAVPAGMAGVVDDMREVQAVRSSARGGGVLDGGVWAGMGESLRCYLLSLVAGADWERWHRCAWTAMPDAMRDALTVEIKAIRREVRC